MFVGSAVQKRKAVWVRRERKSQTILHNLALITVFLRVGAALVYSHLEGWNYYNAVNMSPNANMMTGNNVTDKFK